MTTVNSIGAEIQIAFTKEEALVFFEFLSRNCEKHNWNNDSIIAYSAEKKILIDIENSFEQILDEPFTKNYMLLLDKARKSLECELDEKDI